MYAYLVAGLPELSFPGEVKDFDFPSLTDTIKDQLIGKDAKLLRTVLMGLKAPVPYFYHTAKGSTSPFIREYFTFDRLLRQAQGLVAAKKLRLDNQPAETDPETITDEIKQALDIPNLLEREQKIDALRWNRANEITAFNHLDIEYVLAFVVKAALVDRWMKMDKLTGAAFFEQLINEVRGTFDIEKVKEQLA